MATGPDITFLEESTEYSKEAALKRGLSTRPKTHRLEAKSKSEKSTFTMSSPAVLEPSKDKSRLLESRRKEDFLRKLLIRSLPQSSPGKTRLMSSCQSIAHDFEQQMDELLVQHGSNCCTTVIDCYKNSVVRFRNSAFMHIIQLLFSSLPVSAIAMGIFFARNCPKANFVPAFGAVIGIIGVIFMSLWIVATCNNRHGTPCSAQQKIALGVFCFLLSVLTILDTIFIASLSPSFDPTVEDYCNETFYNYAFYKEIATAVAVVLSAILYFPGSSPILCCHDCSMRSPANAFYYSL